MWHTWFDRDLILAGKLVVKSGDSYKTKLWRSQQALFKIPNLAIHLISERKKFEPNEETELRPIFSSEIYRKLLNPDVKEEKSEKKGRIFAPLLQKIAQESEVNPEDILDYDLYFADSNPASFFGLHEEFISSPRLDNLFSSFHALISLI